jgi:S1-C subfamily serine protease
LRHHNFTSWVVNIIPIVAAGGFASHLLWQIWMPNVSHIAKAVTVRIDGANTGSGVIIEQQGNRYVVLSNWHVVSDDRQTRSRSVSKGESFKIQTVDQRQHLAIVNKIVRIGKLDLATLEFQSKYRYPTATIGNSDRLMEGDTLYVSGWADPSPQLLTRSYQFLVGNLSGRIDRPRDGYALIYTVNALPGMSGGPILDTRGNLVGINGRATVDLRTGTVNSVLGIDINRYLRARGDLPRQKL